MKNKLAISDIAQKIMGIASNVGEGDFTHIGFNISPLTDIEAFEFKQDERGVYYTNAGVFPINAITGGNNTQKTGKLVFDISRILFRYPKAVITYYDAESTLQIGRLEKMVDDLYGIKGYFEENIMGSHFIYVPASAGKDGTSMHNYFKDLIKSLKETMCSKDKAAIEGLKEITTVSPFWSKYAKKHQSVIGPFLFVCDSITETVFDNLVDQDFEDGDIDAGGKKNTRDMKIGKMRKNFMEDICRLGPRVGVYSYWVAQMTDKFSLDGKPIEKESGFIKQGKKASAPKTILRLPHVGREIIKGTVLKQSDGTATYPTKKFESLNNAKKNPDLIEYNVSIFRNKTGKSVEVSTPFIASQEQGINENLSMYRALVQDGYFGLAGSQQRHHCVLYPDLTFGRTTVRDLLDDDPRLARAIAICYQLWYLQRIYNSLKPEHQITPQEMYERIKEQGHDWNELLDTIDYWHDNPEFIKAKTLSIMELLEIAVNKKPLYWKESN